MLEQTINIEGLSLDKFIEYHVANNGWVLEKGSGRSQLIVLPRNEFNHPGLKKNASDGMPFEHITRIFPILSWNIKALSAFKESSCSSVCLLYQWFLQDFITLGILCLILFLFMSAFEDFKVSDLSF